MEEPPVERRRVTRLEYRESSDSLEILVQDIGWTYVGGGTAKRKMFCSFDAKGQLVSVGTTVRRGSERRRHLLMIAPDIEAGVSCAELHGWFQWDEQLEPVRFSIGQCIDGLKQYVRADEPSPYVLHSVIPRPPAPPEDPAFLDLVARFDAHGDAVIASLRKPR